MNSIIMEKFPFLSREGFGYTFPSPIRVREDIERREGAMKNCKRDIFFEMQQNSVTAMRDINSEGNQNDSVKRSKKDIILNLKHESHKRPFDPNNCYTDYNYFRQKDENRLVFDSFTEHQTNCKQTCSRRQEKSDTSKLDHFKSNFRDIPKERCATNSKLLNGYKISHKGRLYENEIRMTQEIHKKELLLQEKLLRAVETLEKVRIGSESEDQKKEDQRNVKRSEFRLYDAEKANWNWKNDRGRILRGRRHEPRDVDKDGIKREECDLRDTRVYQKEKINIQRTTKNAKTKLDYFEKMTRQIRQSEKDKITERAAEWQRIEKWDQSDWQEKEISKAYDGEKRRREWASVKKHTDKEDEAQHWSKMEKIAYSQINEKDVFNHDKWDLLRKNNMATQDKMQNPLSNDASTIRNTEDLQVNLIPESASDLNLQLLPCKVCHRKFKEDRLEKHINICQRTQKPKGQVYDSSKHRIKGTEIEEFIKKNGRSKTPEPKKSKRQDAFIQSIRQPQSRGFQPREDPYSDYVTCPHCNRRFAPGPAETHIPKCINIKSRPPPPRQRHQM